MISSVRRKLGLDTKSKTSSIDINGGESNTLGANGRQDAPFKFRGNGLEEWSYSDLTHKTTTDANYIQDLAHKLVTYLEDAAIEFGERKEYAELQNKLEASINQLREWLGKAEHGHLSQLYVTKAAEWFCNSIRRELDYIQGRQNDNNWEQQAEGGDEDHILGHYSRMQSYVDSIMQNIAATATICDAIVHPSSVDYNSKHKQVLYRGPCAKGTRVDILDQIFAWVDDPISGSVYWMTGMAGTGKTAIAYSLCEKLNARGNLAASFFCCRPLQNSQSVGDIIHSIARQLAKFSHPFHRAFSDVLQKDPDLQNGDLHLQFDALISQPLLEVKNALPSSLIVVIDGLEQCHDGNMAMMLEVLLARSPSLPLKFIVSSRPEPEIQKNQESLRLVLHELDRGVVRADIETYLRDSLGSMKLSEEEIAALVKRAGVLFAFAGALVHYIRPDDSDNNSRERLASILDLSSVSNGVCCQEVDGLYTAILQSALDDANLNEVDKGHMRQVLYLVVSSHETLDLDAIASLIMKDASQARAVLRPFWSVFYISKENKAITTLHPSFSEYMLDKSRSKQYHCDPKVYSQTMVLRCFRIFKDLPHQFNICDLDTSYMADNDVHDLESRVNSRISADLFYAAQTWAEHLKHAIGSPELLRRLEDFLSLRLLLWMEIMNLKQCSHLMPNILRSAEEWTESIMGTSRLRMLIHDALCFTTVFAFGEVRSSTPHIYTTMLPLWPESSPVVRCYAKRIQRAFRVEGTAIDQRQFALLATWGFGHTTASPVYSPTGDHIAVGLGDKICLLSALTGQIVSSPLEWHGHTILLLNFSPDGARVLSCSINGLVRVWNTQGVQKDLNIKSPDPIVWASFSPDGARICGVGNDTIRVWDSYTGQCIIGPLASYETIFEVRYSPHGRWITTCGWNGIVLRNAQDGQVVRTLRPNETGVPIISFDISSDSTQIAAYSRGGGIYVWNIEIEKPTLGPLRTPRGYSSFSSISFSPDGAQIVSGSIDGSIYLWNSRRGTILLGPLEGHTGSITSAGFSPDGHYIMSGSNDKTIRLWDTRNPASAIKVMPTRRPGHDCPVTSVGFSRDGTRIISGSSDQTICAWDIDVSNEHMVPVLGPLEKDISDKVLVAYSPTDARIISNSRSGIAILDAQGDITLGPVHTRQSVQSAIFSPDGNSIIVAQTDGFVQVLKAGSEDKPTIIRPPISNRSDWVTSIAASPDGTRIAVGSIRASLSMYDSKNGLLIYDPLGGCTNEPRALAFSPDSSRVVSGSFATILVRDARDGSVALGPLVGHTDWVHSVEYSSGGTYIVSGARDSAICLWDAQTGQLALGPMKFHTAPVRSVRFSPDGTCIVSGSDDKAIRVTDIRKESQFERGPSNPTGSDWTLSVNGWVVDEHGNLLTWVPPELRASLMWPRTKLLISRKGWLRLNFRRRYLGESWTKCYN